LLQLQQIACFLVTLIANGLIFRKFCYKPKAFYKSESSNKEKIGKLQNLRAWFVKEGRKKKVVQQSCFAYAIRRRRNMRSCIYDFVAR